MRTLENNSIVQYCLWGLVLVLGSLTTQLYAAWSGPQATPPAANAPTPLTLSSVNQTKGGGLRTQSLVPTDPALLIKGPLWIQDGSEGEGKVLTSDIDGIASWQTVSGSGSSGLTRLDQGTGIVLTPAPITATGKIGADTNYLQRRIGNCSSGEVARSVNANGSLNCEPLPMKNCTYKSKSYSPGARCELSSIENNCTSGRIYHNLICQEDGTWSRNTSQCGASTDYPVCGL